MRHAELSVRMLARSSLVVAGLLLLCIGLGDVVVGRTKLAQYQAVLAQAPAVRPRDPAILFPKVTEAEEQRSVARAKLGFYNLLFLAGQLLTVVGLLLVVVGVVRLLRGTTEPLVIARSR
jgi:hypothetical protein